MSLRSTAPVDLSLPDLQLELVEDLSPQHPEGFLKLVRRRLRVRHPDGSTSAPFVYDEVARKACDAVVIAAHFQQAGEPWIYLRSSLRPPVRFRDAARSPLGREETGLLWELPAGLIEPGEQNAQGVVQAGRRELEEELGFAARESDFEALGPSTLSCAGVMGERHFFVSVPVIPATRAEPSLDGSALEQGGRVISLPLRRALELCRSGEIEDAKTELGLRRLAERSLLAPNAG
jgi:ADP-ribose pyrophosphatase